MSEIRTILDHIDEIEVPGDVFRPPANEYWALVYLRKGLEFLAQQVDQCETIVRNQIGSPPNTKLCSFGNLPEFSDLPKGLLTCSFQWYSISACQYVRTVGAIAKSNDTTRLKPHDYLETVIPEVKVFRDKVAAHFVWASRNKKDNDAERLLSKIPNLVWSDGHFFVSGWSASLHKTGRGSVSADWIPWSVSIVHRRLCDRYWRKLGQAAQGDV